MHYLQCERIRISKPNSLTWEPFLWKCWELPEVEVKFQIWMASFGTLALIHLVKSTGLKKLMPPRIYNSLSGDKEIKYLHILGITLGVTVQILSWLFTPDIVSGFQKLFCNAWWLIPLPHIISKVLLVNDQHICSNIFKHSLIIANR